MSDILGTYFFFGNAEYLWGIAVDPVFALLVWIVPSLRKRARAGRECRLAGIDSPYTGMRKSYLSGMTHLPKARYIRGATPPGRGQLQPPAPLSPPRVSGARPGAAASGGLVGVIL